MKKLNILFLAGAVVSVLLCGCGSSSYESSKESAASSYATDNMYMAEEAVEYDYAYEPEAPAEATADNGIDDSTVAKSARKIIKNVNISCETEEFDSFIANIEAKVNSLGGYLESTDISGRSINASKSQKRNANLVARIPSNNLSSFVTEISDKSNITYKSESAEDVTLNYADTEAHIKSLRTEQDRLNELLLQADDIETIIAIESRITDVRYELESYESRLRTIDNKVDYSTVNINVQEVERYTVVEEPEQTVWQRISIGFTENLISAGEIFTDFFVGIIVAIPIIIVVLIVIAIPIAIIACIILFIIGRVKGPDYREELKSKRAAKKARNEEIKAARKARSEKNKPAKDKTAEVNQADDNQN